MPSDETWITQDDDTDPFLGLNHVDTPEEYKERHIQLMTAALMWFGLLSILAIVGAFVVKLVIYIV